jgi:hypothetical protein
MVDSNPELKVKKIRGGFLKIQGTWYVLKEEMILPKDELLIIEIGFRTSLLLSFVVVHPGTSARS